VGATEALERRFRTRSVERTSLGQLGFLGEVENGQVEEVTRLAIRGTEVFADLGVPAEDLAIVAAELRRQLDDVASAFLRLFVDHVWKPFERAGEREKAMDELLQAVERLRPVGSAVAGSLFQVAMSEALEQRFGSELKQLELQRSG
jgi:hypothetical protein